MIRSALAALLLASPSLAHQPADFATGPGFRVSLVRSGPAGAFRVALDRDSLLPDGSIVGFTDEGATVLMEVVSRDNAVRTVFRAPWVTPTCSLRDGDGGPRYEVDPAEGSLLLTCVGAQRQLWRFDGFLACPCPALRASLSSIEDGDDPGPQGAIVPTQPIPIGAVAPDMVVGFAVESIIVNDEWLERKATWDRGHRSSPRQIVDPDELSAAEIEAQDREDDEWLHWRVVLSNHPGGCSPSSCDALWIGETCIERHDDDTEIEFTCDGARWVQGAVHRSRIAP